jgi:hypothetical protein
LVLDFYEGVLGTAEQLFFEMLINLLHFIQFVLQIFAVVVVGGDGLAVHAKQLHGVLAVRLQTDVSDG